MSRGIILGVGLLALTFLAFLCIPRHLPGTPSASVRPSFSASLENGQLTLSGVVGSAEAKQAALDRAHELAKIGKLHVTDDLKVVAGSDASRMGNSVARAAHAILNLASPSGHPVGFGSHRHGQRRRRIRRGENNTSS